MSTLGPDPTPRQSRHLARSWDRTVARAQRDHRGMLLARKLVAVRSQSTPALVHTNVLRVSAQRSEPFAPSCRP